MSYFYTIVTSLILNVTVYLAPHSAQMETSEYFMFGKICYCIAVFGNIGESNLLYMVDLIIFLFGHFYW